MTDELTIQLGISPTYKTMIGVPTSLSKCLPGKDRVKHTSPTSHDEHLDKSTSKGHWKKFSNWPEDGFKVGQSLH